MSKRRKFLVKRVSLSLNLSPLNAIISFFSDVLIEYPGGKQVREERLHSALYTVLEGILLVITGKAWQQESVATLGVRKLTDHRPSTHGKLDNRKQSWILKLKVHPSDTVPLARPYLLNVP